MLTQKLKRAAKRSLVISHRLYAPLLSDTYRPYSFAGGRIYLDIKESPMMLSRALGLYEAQKTEAIMTCLKPGATFVDVGANKGDFTLLASKIVGANGKVFSFEPAPSNCEWVRRSIKLNGYHNVTLYELALSDTNGRGQLYLGDKSGWHSLVPDRTNSDRKTLSVVTRTLDSVLKEAHQCNVDMIKIDVEGFELEVLQGAYSTLSSNRDIILLIDIHPASGVDPREVCGFLSKLGFSIYQMKPPFDKPARVDGHLKEILARRRVTN